MFIYLLFISFLLVCHLIQPRVNSKKLELLAIPLAAIFLCMGYMTGSDWRGYELHYSELYFEDVFSGRYEPGFTLYQSIFRFFGVPFFVYNIFSKLITFFVFYSIIKKISPKYRYLCLMYYTCVSGYAVFIDYSMRNVMAVTIAMYSLRYYSNRQLWKWMVASLLAMSFHTTAVILFPLYFVRFANVKSKYIFAVFIVFNIAMMSLQDSFFEKVNFLAGISEHAATKYEYYATGIGDYSSGKGLSLGYLFNVSIFLIILLFRKEIISNYKCGEMLFVFSVLHTFFYRIGLSVTIFGRFELFFSLIHCIAFVCCISFIKKKIWRQSILIIVFLFSLMSTYIIVTSNTKFVPYTNYLFHLNDNLNYNQRDNYNYINSPYKNKQE